jgi:hypothetical protein
MNGNIVRSGSMTETAPGRYDATLAPLFPLHGNAQVSITINCPNSTSTVVPFDMYIDPSGAVKTISGYPVFAATVTLYRSTTISGTFEVVADGSELMSLANRHNPSTTDATGRFSWDVVAGFYKVRSEKAGCVSPDDPNQSFVESEVMMIPPAVLDLDLRLECSFHMVFLPVVAR